MLGGHKNDIMKAIGLHVQIYIIEWLGIDIPDNRERKEFSELRGPDVTWSQEGLGTVMAAPRKIIVVGQGAQNGGRTESCFRSDFVQARDAAQWGCAGR